MQAQSAMIVVLAGDEGGGAGGIGDLNLITPAPAKGERRRVGAVVDECAASPFRFSLMPGQLGLGETARQQEPAVIGHNPQATPAGVPEFGEALDDLIELMIEIARQTQAMLMSVVVEIAGLSPGTAGWIARRLAVQRLEALFGEQPAEVMGGERLAVAGDLWREILIRGVAHGERRNRRAPDLARGRHRRQARPAHLQLDPTQRLQAFLESDRHVIAQTIDEDQASSVAVARPVPGWSG